MNIFDRIPLLTSLTDAYMRFAQGNPSSAHYEKILDRLFAEIEAVEGDAPEDGD